MKKLCVLFSIVLLLGSCNNNQNIGSENTSISEFNIIGPETLNVGQIAKYEVSSEMEVNFESSDELVLSINSRGEAIAYKVGEVEITATVINSTLTASLKVEVKDEMAIPHNQLELTQLFNQALNLEGDANEFYLETKASNIKQDLKRSAKMYKDHFYLETLEEKYENYSGKHEEHSTKFDGISGDYYYQVIDSDVTGYGIKRKLVDANPSTYDILRSEAEKRGDSPSYISSFYNELVSMWEARTLTLEINGEKDDDGFTLNLKNIYLFVWADEVSNDSRLYEAELKFNNDGFFKEGSLKKTYYDENQYDVSSKSFVENPVVSKTESYAFKAIRGEKYNSSDIDFNPSEYFVTSVTVANYEGDVHVGDRIRTDYISLVEYEGEKSLDTKNFNIVGIQNPPDQVVIMEDSDNIGYVAMSSGIAYIKCQMIFSPEVIFFVEVEVLEA